jgi:hypothetical protein
LPFFGKLNAGIAYEISIIKREANQVVKKKTTKQVSAVLTLKSHVYFIRYIYFNKTGMHLVTSSGK